jgi:hypothetical protein
MDDDVMRPLTVVGDPDSYKIKQENGRRGENKVHSLSPFLLFVSG